MNDGQKTKEQLLGELERERERSLALQEVSNLLAAAHDTDEVLDLIVNEAARLVGTTGAWMRLLEGDVLLPGVATESAAEILAELARLQPTILVGKESTIQGRVMTKVDPIIKTARGLN